MGIFRSDNGQVRLGNTNPRFADRILDLKSISIEKDGSNWANYFLCGAKVRDWSSVNSIHPFHQRT